MGTKLQLKALIEELDRVHSGAIPWSEENGIPDFVTTENGSHRYFSSDARKELWSLSNTLHSNRPQSSTKVEINEYYKYVRQAVADIHSAEDFPGFQEDVQQTVIERLKLMVEEHVSVNSKEFTHYLPVWTLGMERKQPFHLGPATFLDRNDWIDSVDFPQSAKDRYLNEGESNYQWKDILKEALLHPHGENKAIKGLANDVYKAIYECPAILKVSVRDYEKTFSQKLSKLIAKTALDAISLGFGSPECFQQQTLQDERLPPYRSHSLIATNGLLWLPGSYLGKRVRTHSLEQIEKALDDLKPFLTAAGSILSGLADPSTHKHPKLAMRWATALDWYGEGNRESSDAIALAKLGTCLDVLSCGGKYGGILNMVIHLTGINADKEVVQNPAKTLAQVVKSIYDDGRSRILHGTHSDRLKSFEAVRHQAAYLARIVLIESAVRLEYYQGKDIDVAFRSIPCKETS